MTESAGETARLKHPASFGRAIAALLKDGRTARRQGDHALALARFEQALAIDPRDRGVQIERGHVLTELSREDEAEAIFRGVLDETPAQMGALYGMGRLARRRGKPAEAETYFRQMLAQRPNDAGARGELAAILAERADPEAEALFRGLLADSPGHRGALIGLARLKRQRGELPEALALLEEVAANEPGDPWIAIERARILGDLGRTADARRLLTYTLRSRPDHTASWMAMGAIERQAHDRAAALAAFRRAAEADPAAPQPWVEIAIEERMAGRAAESLAALGRALDRWPDHLPALIELAEHHRMAERHDEALAAARHAVSCHPGSVKAAIALIRALAMALSADSAIDELAQAEMRLGPDPEFDRVRLQLALDAGHYDRAASALAGSGSRFRHADLWADGIRLSIKRGKLDSATAALADPPTQTVPDRARAHALRSLIAHERWDLIEALHEAEAALSLNPGSAMVHEELALLGLLRFDLAAVERHLTALHRIRVPARILQGRSRNRSQQFLAQILDEHRLDSDLAETLAGLTRLQAQARIEPLRQIICDRPGSTAPSIALLVALRQAGMLDDDPKCHKASIPPRIVQFWNDPEPPPDIIDLMQSWPDRNPSHEYRRFDDRAAQDFLAERYAAPVRAAYARARNPAQKSDLFRLAFLFAEGGFYADADDRCLGGLAALDDGRAVLLGYQEEYGTIGNNFLGAIPREAVIGRALAAVVAAINRGDHDLLWLASGPGAVTRAFAREVALAADPGAVLGARRILTRAELAGTIACHCRVRYKVTAHWSKTALAPRPAFNPPAPSSVKIGAPPI